MSFSSNKPSNGINPLGIQEKWTARNQQAVPVPCLNGRDRIGVTWISDPFNLTLLPTNDSKAKGGSSSQKNTSASIACLICNGPVDYIFAIYINGNLVWGIPGPYSISSPHIYLRGRDGTADYVDITLPTPGRLRIYWGTETQVPDPLMNTLGVPDPTNPNKVIKHSAMRGWCYGVFYSLALGASSNFPNVEIVAGRYPSRPWLTPLANDWHKNIAGDANPIATSADWLQDARIGAGLPDSLINIDAANAVATQLAKEQFGLSSLLTEQTPLADQLNTLMEYYNGTALVDENGYLNFGLKRPVSARAGLPVVGLKDMIGRPTFEVDDFSKCVSDLRVNFANQNHDLLDDYVAWIAPGIKDISEGVAQPSTFDGKYITRPDLAAKVAAAMGAQGSVPPKTGKVTLIRSILPLSPDRPDILYNLLVPGALFLFNYPARDLGLMVFRVTDRTVDDPTTNEFSISFEADLTDLYPGAITQHVPAGDTGGGGIVIDQPDEEEIVIGPLDFVRLVELPLALCPGGKVALAVLASRNDQRLSGCDVYLGNNYEVDWP